MNLHNEMHEPGSDECELIAFHLGEPCAEQEIRLRLQSDTAFAELSESVSQTLRIFSAEPVDTPDVDVAWHRLRVTLPYREVVSAKRTWRWFVFVPVTVMAVLLIAAGLLLPRLRHRTAQPDEAGVIHLVPTQTSGQVPQIADHLERAERWLTTVNNMSAPLDTQTLAEGEELQTHNALYLRKARSSGDLPDAFALERLDRVLITARHAREGGVRLRVEMNTDGLLFDLRILRQNHSQLHGEAQ